MCIVVVAAEAVEAAVSKSHLLEPTCKQAKRQESMARKEGAKVATGENKGRTQCNLEKERKRQSKSGRTMRGRSRKLTANSSSQAHAHAASALVCPVEVSCCCA